MVKIVIIGLTELLQEKACKCGGAGFRDESAFTQLDNVPVQVTSLGKPMTFTEAINFLQGIEAD